MYFIFCDILNKHRWCFLFTFSVSNFLERRRLVYHGWSPFLMVTLLLGMNCLVRFIKYCVMREVISLTFCLSQTCLIIDGINIFEGNLFGILKFILGYHERSVIISKIGTDL